MLMDLLILFIVLSILFFILSVYLMETNPMLSIPFIMLGMIFTILCTYGMWHVEVLYADYNATLGTTTTSVHAMNYGEPYSYIFMFFFFIFMILFFRAGFNMWSVALQQKGEMDFKGKGFRRR
jgi:hypothetical protein